MFGQFIIMLLALAGTVYSLFNGWPVGILVGLIIAVVAFFRLVGQMAKGMGPSSNF
ncbi:hypothetical protein ACWCPQ_24970 [Nocardia sp. NPDC001965]